MRDIFLNGVVFLPGWVDDLESFRRWTRSENFPQHGSISYLEGNVWVEVEATNRLHSQKVLAQSLLETEISMVLAAMAKSSRRGRLIGAGTLMTAREANVSTEPAMMFVSYEALREGRARVDAGAGSVEVEGGPDAAIEVTGPASAQKASALQGLYWKAGVREYWVAEPGGEQPRFEILRHTTRGFRPTRSTEGWMKSAVFGHSFRLSATRGTDDLPEYTLEVR